MFRSMTNIRDLTFSLAKVTFIKSVKVRRYGPCGCVAACYIKCVRCALCAVQNMSFCTAHSAQRTHLI
jgi:hypothetical protein